MKIKTMMESPLGPLRICATAEGITDIQFVTEFEHEGDTSETRENTNERSLSQSEQAAATEQLAEAVRQLEQYFTGERTSFDLSLKMEGTAFQQRVWQSLAVIPYGETRSYQEIAEAIGSPLAVRAVGGANNRNKLPIVIPCHRVIGKNGKLIGYAGGMETKAKLLELERPMTAG
ncbi:methylated-DNA--[protein]-cysteine S-methyltransferase [Marinicrinis sediminis]|uniref:Methylated-DNA--protein-cysteine methyltransferase n=1 Tax=Marinicrinis sediminis TaxID=1652465 RepID=A0ABW5RF62_9BACL